MFSELKISPRSVSSREHALRIAEPEVPDVKLDGNPRLTLQMILSLGQSQTFDRLNQLADQYGNERWYALALLSSAGKQQWLLSDYDLDLRAEGLGNFRTSSRLLDPGSRHVQGYLHRSASFAHQRQGRRLLVHVQHSGKSETGDLQEPQLAGLGLFIFNEQLELTYRVRRLDPQSVLISSGRGDVLLCKQLASPR